MSNEADKKLVELFEYHFGVDLEQSKYQEGLAELLALFVDARREGYNAGYRQGLVDFEARIGAEGRDLVRLNSDVSTDTANPPSGPKRKANT